MFRMKFETTDTADEYEENCAESVGGCLESASTVIYEGRVGKFGKIRRFPNLVKAVAHSDSSPMRLTLSPDVATTGSKSSADVDLEGPVQDAEVPRYAIVFAVDVLKEPVRPYAEPLHVEIQGSTIETLSDKNVIVANILCQSSVKRQDGHMDSVNSQAPEGRTHSVRSASPVADSECCLGDMNEGKLARENESEAETGMTNKLMQKRKLNDRFAKPLEEPLLAGHDQAKLNLMAKEEAESEAERLAEEERRNCQRQQHELQDLANCVGSAATRRDVTCRESKLKKILCFLENPFRVFRSQKIKHVGYPISREAKVTNPNARLFSVCLTVPSGPPDSVLATMRNVSEKSISRSNMQFAEACSTNGDVRAWTREEYLRKNEMILDEKDDEEFGGVFGNNYLNNNVVAGMAGVVDSDSDSDSD